MPRILLPLAVLAVVLPTLVACSTTRNTSPVTARQSALLEVNHVLDDFHDAAARADMERYFGHLTAHAVFLGTDAWERWPKESFREYAAPHFLGESAWAYTPRDRSVTLGAEGKTAWFDETVVNEKYGALRGSGVLELGSDGRWRISQYNLSFTVPNEIAADVVDMIGDAAGPDQR